MTIDPQLLERLLALAEKNGDRIVISDAASGKAIVLLDLAAYEKLVGAESALQPESSPVLRFSGSPVTPAPPNEEPKPKTRSSTPTDNPFEKRAVELLGMVERGPENPLLTRVAPTFTIERDLDDRRAVQERKRVLETDRGQRREAGRATGENTLEDEERFYLEPIE